MHKKQITLEEYDAEKEIIKDEILFANASPSYEKVCEYYEKHRAACGKKKGENVRGVIESVELKGN